MIICVTPNPALDRTLHVPGFAPEGVFRTRRVMVDAGGKGINVARAIQILGGEALCTGFLGGDTGQRVAQQVQADGIKAKWSYLANGETRTCVIIVDPVQATSAVINEPGPAVSDADWECLHQDIVESGKSASAVCFCGSLPLVSPLEKYKQLLAYLVDMGCKVWVDTSGASLSAATAVPGVSLKINVEEAGALLEQQINTWELVARAAARLHQQLAAPVVLTRGSEGALMTDRSGTWMAVPPPIKLVSSVGSGDSFLAGLLVALERGAAAPEALCYAVAAGAANAQSLGGARFTLADFKLLLAQTKTQILS